MAQPIKIAPHFTATKSFTNNLTLKDIAIRIECNRKLRAFTGLSAPSAKPIEIFIQDSRISFEWTLRGLLRLCLNACA
jgi:hypothetical protein